MLGWAISRLPPEPTGQPASSVDRAVSRTIPIPGQFGTKPGAPLAGCKGWNSVAWPLVRELSGCQKKDVSVE